MKIPIKVKIISEEHNGAISFRLLAITKWAKNEAIAQISVSIWIENEACLTYWCQFANFCDAANYIYQKKSLCYVF